MFTFSMLNFLQFSLSLLCLCLNRMNALASRNEIGFAKLQPDTFATNTQTDALIEALFYKLITSKFI